MTKKITFTVEFAVDPTWIADGFYLDAERALEMLSNDLRYADVCEELDARIVKHPDAAKVAKLMGYSSVEEMRARYPETRPSHQWANAE
jgi:hypothetical protein